MKKEDVDEDRYLKTGGHVPGEPFGLLGSRQSVLRCGWLQVDSTLYKNQDQNTQMLSHRRLSHFLS